MVARNMNPPGTLDAPASRGFIGRIDYRTLKEWWLIVVRRRRSATYRGETHQCVRNLHWKLSDP